MTAATNSKTYDGTTTAAAVPTITSGSLGSGDTANFTETYDTKNVGTSKTLTAAGSVSDGNSGNNYTVTLVTNTTGAITARSLTVSATGVNKVYDGTTAATVTLSDNKVTGDNVTDSYATATFADASVGTGKVVSVSGISIGGSDAGNYALSSTTASTTANITAAAPGTISGYVYTDANNDGQRQISPGVYHAGIPGVTITLTRTDATAPDQVVLTGSDGSYSFSSVPAGTYQETETPPAKFLPGKPTAGSLGGTAVAPYSITNIQVGIGQTGSEYDFSAAGLQAAYVSQRLFLASTPTSLAQIMQQIVTDPPVVRVGGSASRDYQTTFTVGRAAVSVESPAATVTHANGGNLASLIVSITNIADGAAETLTVDNTTPSAPAPLPDHPSITAAYANGVLSLVGIASAGEYQSALDTIQYQDAASSPNTTARIITFVANDATAASEAAVTTVTFQAAASSQVQSLVASPSVLPSSSPGRGCPTARPGLADQVLGAVHNWLGR